MRIQRRPSTAEEIRRDANRRRTEKQEAGKRRRAEREAFQEAAFTKEEALWEAVDAKYLRRQKW